MAIFWICMTIAIIAICTAIVIVEVSKEAPADTLGLLHFSTWVEAHVLDNRVGAWGRSAA